MQDHARKARRRALALAVIAGAAATQAGASGFQLRENSTKALGRANAGSAVAPGDAAVVSNNPAAMAQFAARTVQNDITLIDLTARFTGSACTPASAGTCVPIGGGDGGDPGDPTLVPALALVVPLSGAFERITLGASITAPFGLATEYEPAWVGRYNATTSELKVPALTLSVAYEVSETLSIGAGFIFQQADVTLANGIDFGRLLAAAGIPGATVGNPATDGSLSLSGADNGTGWLAGVQFTPGEAFSIGYSHRSEVDHHVAGQADFTVPPAYAAAPGRDPRRAAIPQLLVLGNGFTDTVGEASLTTPAIDTISALWSPSAALRLYVDVQRTGWSSVQGVEIDYENAFQPDSEEPFNWRDTMFYGVGAEFDVSDALTLRGGFAIDESPTNDIDRTPRLPDDDRMLYSLGFSWGINSRLTLDAAYQRITIDDPAVDVLSSSGSRLSGSFDGSANLFALGVNYRF